LSAIAEAPEAYRTPWLPVSPPPEPGIRLFCFPHAGAGSLAYQEWSRLLPSPIQVLPVLPPGRETRFGEPPYTRIEPYIEDLATALAPQLRAPYALFGHSLGALVAFELARRVRTSRLTAPVHLFVSGRIAPQLTEHRRVLHQLPAGDLAREVTALGGVPRQVDLSDQRLGYLLAALRADLTVNETYAFRTEPVLGTAVTALGGTADPRVNEGELAAWRAQTSGPFTFRTYRGGHFYVTEHRRALLSLVARTLLPAGSVLRRGGRLASAGGPDIRGISRGCRARRLWAVLHYPYSYAGSAALTMITRTQG
jgi:medium-chain acyl-[acyl-carrier-protein] hydrolase